MIEISHTQLIDLRQQAGWTQEQAAEQLSYTRAQYKSLESPTGVNISPLIFFLLREYIENPLLKRQFSAFSTGEDD